MIVTYFRRRDSRNGVHNHSLSHRVTRQGNQSVHMGAKPQINNLMKRNCKTEEMCEKEILQKILRIVEGKEEQPFIKANHAHGLYDNQSLMAALKVSGAYLRKLRDNGYLGFSRHGDKYWYTQEDVDRFLKRFHYEAFAVGDLLPEQKGNIHG